MPVYEYQGKHYDLSETDPAAAKAKILKFLGQEEKPKGASVPEYDPMGAYIGEQQVEPVKPTPGFQRGYAIGAMTALPGLPGELESLGRAGLRKLGSTVSAKPVLPTTEEVGTKVFGEPKTTAEAGGRTTGSILGVPGGIGLAPTIGKLAELPKLGIVGRALGEPTQEAAKSLRQRALGEVGKPAARTEAELSQLTAAERKAQEEAARQQKFAQRAEQQISRQPAVAAERAAQAPLTAEQQAAALQAQVRKPVREELGAQRAAAEQRATQAERVAAGAEQATVKAQQAVTDLERQLLARPTTSAEDFGKLLRDATEKMSKDLIAARETESGLGKILRGASKEPTINTSPLIARAQELARETRNPNLLGLLDEVQALAKTGEKSGLSLVSADSLRKTLSKDIINKYFAQVGADKETLRAIRELRRSLINEMPKEYVDALGKFRTLSRPLDIVERNGALKKVLDVDALSTAEKLTEAQVVGEIINKARVGNPTFSRLLEVSPQLKDSGRLYFTQDLFGKGAVPTESALRTWLKVNERPLRQLGLYEEFSSIRTAREAAQKAVNDAKLAQTEASMAAKAAEREVGAARGISEESARRLAESLKTATTPTKSPSESLAEALKRTRQPAAEAEKRAAEATKQVGQKQELLNSLRSLETELTTARNPKEIASAVDKTASQMVKQGVITEAQRKALVTEIQALKDTMDAQTRARKQLGYLAGLVGVGYAGRGVVSSAMGGR